MITLGVVNISEKTKQLMAQALDEGSIGQGKYIKEFEEKLAQFLGVRHAIAVSSGTMADACALAAIKEKDGGGRDEVIVPALTFIAQIMEAIIGLGVIGDLPKFIGARHDNAVKIGSSSDNTSEYIAPHCLPVLISSKEKRVGLLKSIPEKYGIEVRQAFCSIPTQSTAYGFLGEQEGSYPVAEDIGNRGLYLPCHQNLSEGDLQKISEVMKKIAHE